MAGWKPAIQQDFCFLLSQFLLFPAMFGALDKYLIVFLTGLAVSFGLTPVVRALACRLGVVDLPNERRPHKRPTARGGGIAVVLAVHAAYLVGLALPGAQSAGVLDIHWWQKFVLASSILVGVGLIDDVRGMKPLVKLSGQILAALVIWFSGTHFGSILGHKLPEALDCVLVVFWLVAIINAFNLIDGLDGLASGLAIISAIGLCGILFMNQSPGNVIFLLGFIGACLGFLRYNFNPASVFLGDTGSMFLGFTLGVVSLQTVTKSTFVLSLTIPLMVLGIPIFDAMLAVWRRTARHWLRGTPGQSPKYGGIMQPDLEHVHHRLLKSGLSIRKVATVLCTLNACLVGFGLLITVFQSHAAGIFLMAFLAGVYVLMRHLAIIELRDTGRALLGGLRRPTHATAKALLYPVWDMACLAGAVALVMGLGEPARPDFWHSWFLDLPVWVSPTFSLLAMSRIYVTVWTRARMRDVLYLSLLLVSGLLLSLGIALLIDPANTAQSLLRAAVIGMVAHPAIVGLRIVYRAIEDVVVYLRAKSDTESENRIVLYGAGGRCQLFLKERSYINSQSYDGRLIVGLIDDETTLHSQWVYGYQVLGGMKDLPRLIERHRISAVVITAALTPAARTAACQMAEEHGVLLTEWHFGERKLAGRGEAVTAEGEDGGWRMDLEP